MLDLHRLKTYPIKERKNLVRIEQFTKLIKPSKEFAAFFDSLPDILGGRDLNRLVDAIVKSYHGKYLVGVGLGAHIIKCGLAPVIIDLMNQGVIKAVAMNGAGAIHDYEISLIGATSEDVGETIKNGRFGMAEETAFAFARACRDAIHKKEGLGRAFGNMIIKDKNKHVDYSIMATAAKLNIPCTLHIAIGTDTVHMHPCISGDELGKAGLSDFHIFTDVICHLNKGAWLNIGSAVILPEVFLKAVSVARNLGHKLQEFTTANLDMIQHYRPRQNVTGRPVNDGINITAQHEIILPLLRLGVLSRL